MFCLHGVQGSMILTNLTWKIFVYYFYFIFAIATSSLQSVCIIWNDLGVSNMIAKVSFAIKFLQYHGYKWFNSLAKQNSINHDDVYHWQYLSWYFVFCNQILHILVVEWMLFQTHANNLNQVLPQKVCTCQHVKIPFFWMQEKDS
jgi:hypothetical protein